MTTQILQHEQHHQAWPMASWVSAAAQTSSSCGGSTWSKRVAPGASAMASEESWEVRAFAEDASSSGQWPPRSYSCSFCQREFRTAQALGGHMNVHRRERAHANQLAQLRNAATPMGSPRSQSQVTTVELLSPKSERHYIPNFSTPSLSSSPLSQESINSSSSTMALMKLQPGDSSILLPDILSGQQNVAATTLSWTPSSRALLYHPYEKSCKPAQGRFSLCLNKVMGEHESHDALVDLELRLGRSSCAV